MPKRREIAPLRKKVCPKNGAKYEEFCMDYICEHQDGTGGCKAVQVRYCKYQNGNLSCDGNCNKCALSEGLNPLFKKAE